MKWGIVLLDAALKNYIVILKWLLRSISHEGSVGERQNACYWLLGAGYLLLVACCLMLGAGAGEVGIGSWGIGAGRWKYVSFHLFSIRNWLLVFAGCLVGELGNRELIAERWFEVRSLLSLS